jgi:hypothetical protein
MARVFVVYDEPITRGTLGFALAKLGHEVVGSSSEGAYDKAQSFPDVEIIIGSAVGSVEGTAAVIALHPSAQVIPLGLSTAGCDLREPFAITEVIKAVEIMCSAKNQRSFDAT